MKGLLLKDALNLKSQALAGLIITVLFMAVAGFSGDAGTFGGSFCTVMMLFIIMLPFTSAAYDERNSWEGFAVSMPISRNAIVFSKYVITFCIAGAAAVLAVIGVVAFGIDPLTAACQIPVGIALNGIILPVIFRFGVEEGRFVAFGIILLIIAGGVLAELMLSDISSGLMEKISELLDEQAGGLYICVAIWIVTVIVTAISIAVSCRVYRTKEF